MKRMWMILTLATLTACESNAPQQDVQLATEQEKLGYAIGMDVGASVARLKGDIDLGAFIQAVRTVAEGGEPRMSKEEAEEVKQAYFARRAKQLAEERKVLGEKNKAAGEAFMEGRKGKEGVITTASGLQFEVLKPGDGPTPTLKDKVKVHYRGMLIDGTEFDSSYKRGTPAVVAVSNVIKGWQEGLQMMKVGGRYRLVIPPHLAYGEQGVGKDIPPYSTLIFEVELLGIETGDANG